ncbi:hypothetical protein [Micromonospora terminaliae]|uniref:Uncharacterized protein n=1 Tax=Micromonospora terminaliae TaxID=1914461 RepID=A0AAJ2ZJQ2_9ACTN|nr:hypothetical protein [Micromonospora terminaliae]NES30308.1 hypothetical protein [Micromonospora terminaliae]
MADHEDEWRRIMGARRPGPEDFKRMMYGGELRLMGCIVFLMAVLMLTGLALQWIARR